MAATVVRLYGKADSFDLEFVRAPDGFWRVKVPADLSDGQYVVELTACKASGCVGHWSGILYMSQGEPRIALLPSAQGLAYRESDLALTPLPTGERLIFRGCHCAL